MALRLALALIAVVSVLTFDASAQREGRGHGYSGITVFEHPEFRGASVTFREEIPDLRAHGLNDRISSLEIAGRQAWEVCRDIDFGGGCRVFTGDVGDLRTEGWNDRISSLRAVGVAAPGNRRGSWWSGPRQGGPGRGGHLVLYSRAHFRGESREVASSSAVLGPVGDRARSAQLVGGGAWELCEGVFRNARCVTIDADVPDLHSLGLRSGLTSVRQVSSRW